MPSIEWNQKTWDNSDLWLKKRDGESWSDPWGNSSVQWAVTLYPRIHNFLPCGNVLEIAPGRGRWTPFLLKNTMNAYRGIDLSEQCVMQCIKKFAIHKQAKFVKNNGMSLSGVADLQYDLIFSFDSLVHASIEVLAEYIKQILGGLLNDNGVCFIHHSNAAFANQYNTTNKRFHARDKNVSAAAVAASIAENNGRVLCQEIITWRAEPYIDALTLFCRKECKYQSPGKQFFINLENMHFEAEYGKAIMTNYTFDPAYFEEAESGDGKPRK